MRPSAVQPSPPVETGVDCTGAGAGAGAGAAPDDSVDPEPAEPDEPEPAEPDEPEPAELEPSVISSRSSTRSSRSGLPTASGASDDAGATWPKTTFTDSPADEADASASP